MLFLAAIGSVLLCTVYVAPAAAAAAGAFCFLLMKVRLFRADEAKRRARAQGLPAYGAGSKLNHVLSITVLMMTAIFVASRLA